VGENPLAAFAAGKNPHRIQYQALIIAGILEELPGRISRSAWPKPGGMDDRRRGFIAVALVIFSKVHPLRQF